MTKLHFFGNNKGFLETKKELLTGHLVKSACASMLGFRVQWKGNNNNYNETLNILFMKIWPDKPANANDAAGGSKQTDETTKAA